MNANATLSAAIAAGFDRLSTRDVMLCILQGAGNGGAVNANIIVISTGATPTATPVGNAVAFDSSTGSIWNWNGTVWTKYVG